MDPYTGLPATPGGRLGWRGVFGDRKPVVDLPPDPPAVVQQADVGAWERQAAAPPAVGPNPFARWEQGMTSSWDPAGFPDQPISVSLVNVAAAGYNAGWRGEDLVKAVAISIAENRNQEMFKHGDVGIQNKNYGPSIGLWQIRTLKKPWEAGQPSYDRMRTFENTNDGRDLYDIQRNADAAYALWKGRGWGHWSVTHDKYKGTSNDYRMYLDQAREAVGELNRILGSAG